MKALPINEEVRKKCGDVLLVGGKFWNKGVLEIGGIRFPVEVTFRISKGQISFTRVAPREAVL